MIHMLHMLGCQNFRWRASDAATEIGGWRVAALLQKLPVMQVGEEVVG